MRKLCVIRVQAWVNFKRWLRREFLEEFEERHTNEWHNWTIYGSEEFGEGNTETKSIGLGIQGKKHIYLAHCGIPRCSPL